MSLIIFNNYRLLKRFTGKILNLNRTNSTTNQEHRLELTLAIIKPHICKDPPTLQEIRSIILQYGFMFVQSTQIQMTKTQAQLFYQDHQGKFFFDRLVALMTSGESCIHILARVDAIQKWRQLMGPTKVFKTRIDQPDTIRGMYGLTDTRNATHGSDSTITSHKEIKFFFPQFSIENWFAQEEPRWRKTFLLDFDKSKIVLDRKKWIHTILD